MSKQKRRGRGEGSIFKRADGIWVGAVNMGCGADGKRKRKPVYGATKAIVRAKLLELQMNVASGIHVNTTKHTVGQYLAHWLDVAARPTVRPTTHLRYADIIRLHIGPHIGGLPIRKLEPSTVQGLYSILEGRGASPRTRELVHAVLHRALAQGVKWQMLQRNPCDAVEKPRVPKKAMNVWNAEQAARFLVVAEEDRLYALYVVTVTTALRQGENCWAFNGPISTLTLGTSRCGTTWSNLACV